MQIVINITEDGNVSTEVRRKPPTIRADITTAEVTEPDSVNLDAGASPFAISEDAEALEEGPFDAPVELDGGAGPAS